MSRKFSIIPKFILILAVLFLYSCKKEEISVDISGEWELVSFSSGAVEESEIPVSVYLAFDKASASFTIFQKLGEGHYGKYIGEYSCSGSRVRGQYSNGTSWACEYNAELEGNRLLMISIGLSADETCVYARCTIPSDVRKDADDYSTKASSFHIIYSNIK